MTVRLLVQYGKYPKNTNLTTGAEEEARLLRTGEADTNTAAGVEWVPPVPTKIDMPVSMKTTGGVVTLRGDGQDIELAPGEVPAYIGQVATRSVVPHQRHSASKQFNCKRFMTARDRIRNGMFRFPGYMGANPVTVPTGTGAEIGMGGPMTLTATVEYPAGVFTRLTFGGLQSGVVPDLGTLWSDPAGGLEIPDGANFWVHTYGSMIGAGFPVLLNSATTDNTYTMLSERYEHAVSGLTDKTNGTSYTSTVAGGMSYGPDAVVATTTKRSFCIIGDSRQRGFSTIANYDTSGDIGTLPYSIGAKRAYITNAVGGDLAQYWETPAALPNRMQLMDYCSDVVFALGINDLSASRTAPQVQASLLAIVTAADAKGKRIGRATINPVVTGTTDNYANQVDGTGNVTRATVNGWLRTNPFSVRSTYLIDLADGVEVGSVGFPVRDSGRWWFNGTAGQPTPDGLHESRATNALYKRSGLICNAIGI